MESPLKDDVKRSPDKVFITVVDPVSLARPRLYHTTPTEMRLRQVNPMPH